MATASSAERGRKPARILCAGIAVIDYIFQLEQFPRPPAKSRATDFKIACGGNSGAAAIAAARLGGAVKLASSFGDDALADTISGWFAAENVDCSPSVRVPGVASSISAILVDGTGERMITNFRDPRLGDARISDVEAQIASADAVLIDNRLPEFSLPAGHAAKARGIPVLLDADEPTRLTNELLAASTHVVFSAYGLAATAGTKDLAEGLKKVAPLTDAFLCVTNGEEGAFWLEDKTLRRMEAHKIKAVDTLGAGDVYHGAFVLALGEGRSLVETLRFSAAAAAVKCTRFGGVRGAPTAAEVRAFTTAAAPLAIE